MVNLDEILEDPLATWDYILNIEDKRCDGALLDRPAIKALFSNLRAQIKAQPDKNLQYQMVALYTRTHFVESVQSTYRNKEVLLILEKLGNKISR